MNTTDGGSPDLQEEEIERAESVVELSKTISKDNACSAMHTTPNKVPTSQSNDTISKSLPSSSQNVIEENMESVTDLTKTKWINICHLYVKF